jgi:uncharacterized protein YgbK (DUF1537 family)
MLVLSGSCSPVTQKQIEYALENGFSEIELTSKAIESQYQEGIIKDISNQIINHLKNGQSIILHTSLGINDPRIKATEQRLKTMGIAATDIQKQCSKIFGRVIGQITKEVLKAKKIKRILFAGGDTSSYAASELGILALEMIAPLAPGAPLCKAISDDDLVNGLELNFKGGQVGTPDYFIKVLKGERIS